jgi:hypothetical protein
MLPDNHYGIEVVLLVEKVVQINVFGMLINVWKKRLEKYTYVI